MPQTNILEKLKTEEKSSWGGLREGSGRKPRLQYEIRELFNQTIDDEWDNIMRIIKAKINDGDKDVIKWCLEQRIGKAPQNLDINAMGAFLSVSEPINNYVGIDIVEIAKGVAIELKKRKTG